MWGGGGWVCGGGWWVGCGGVGGGGVGVVGGGGGGGLWSVESKFSSVSVNTSCWSDGGDGGYCGEYAVLVDRFNDLSACWNEYEREYVFVVGGR